MAVLGETVVIDQISVDEFGNVSVRRRTDIVRDGVVVASSFHRHVVGPKDSLAGQDERVAAIAKVARKGALPLPEPDEP